MFGRRVGTRLRTAVLVGALAAGFAGLGGSALASSPSQTLYGHAFADPTADAGGISELSVNATRAGAEASGTLSTGGIRGSAGSPTDKFEGTVTCMIISGPRVVVGAFGTAYHGERKYEFEEETFTPLPGKYMQVAVVEFGLFLIQEFDPTFHTKIFGSLGEHHHGLSSAKPPHCKEWGSLKGEWGGYPADLQLSPSITSPKDGATGKETMTLKGSGEPNSLLAVYEPGHEQNFIAASVSSLGKWSVKVKGLPAGTHEYRAQPGEGGFWSNTVTFTVP